MIEYTQMTFLVRNRCSMIRGSMNNISLSSSSIERMITEGKLYVDKTHMIENFLNCPSEVQLIARQRRLGKA